MLKSLAGIGLLLWVIGLMLWIHADGGGELPIAGLDTIAFLLGAVLIGANLLGYIGQTLGGWSFKAKKGRCVRCGKKTLKGEIYCARHLRVVREEFRDAHRKR